MEISIDKQKMWNKLLSKRLLELIYWIIPIIGFKIIVEWMEFGDIPKKYYTFAYFIIAIIVIIRLIFARLLTNTLKYEITDDRLSETYQIITKTKNSARLQVINSIDITQGIIDKILNLFSLNVCYGFGGEGYYFTYNYLSEKQAEELLEKIKPKGKMIDIK